MDIEQDFLSTAAETVAILKRRNSPPRTWTSDDGTTIEGWQFDGTSYGPEVKGNPGSGWWRESWGSTSWILTVDGNFWEHSFSGQDEQGKETQLMNGLGQCRRDTSWDLQAAHLARSKVRSKDSLICRTKVHGCTSQPGDHVDLEQGRADDPRAQQGSLRRDNCGMGKVAKVRCPRC